LVDTFHPITGSRVRIGDGQKAKRSCASAKTGCGAKARGSACETRRTGRQYLEARWYGRNRREARRYDGRDNGEARWHGRDHGQARHNSHRYAPWNNGGRQNNNHTWRKNDDYWRNWRDEEYYDRRTACHWNARREECGFGTT